MFCGVCLKIHPDGAGCFSSSCTQHQGGVCWVCESKSWQGERVDKISMKSRPLIWQGGEDYPMFSKLYLAEIDRCFMYLNTRTYYRPVYCVIYLNTRTYIDRNYIDLFLFYMFM